MFDGKLAYLKVRFSTGKEKNIGSFGTGYREIRPPTRATCKCVYVYACIYDVYARTIYTYRVHNIRPINK